MKNNMLLTNTTNTLPLKRKRYSRLFHTTGLTFVLLTLFLWQCKKDNYQGEIKGVCPAIISTDPANADSSVSPGKVITVVFNEPMDSTTLNSETFTLSAGSLKSESLLKHEPGQVLGNITYSGNTATFVPVGILAANSVYSGTITSAVKDKAGNALPVNYVWSFKTGTVRDSIAPTILSTDPANAATAVTLNKKVTVAFSETMTPSTINATTFTLKQGTTTIAGAISYVGTAATFTPTSNLAASTVYTASVTNGVKDASGNALAATLTWTFTTGTAADVTAPTVLSTDPLNFAINVPFGKIITINFSESMDPLTINSATFLLKKGVTPVAGLVSYAGATAVFAPSANLLPGTTYTATVTNIAKDLAGNALASSYTWSFTTGSVPTVTLTDPLNLASGVALTKVITATFSEPMDPLSIPTAFTIMLGTTTVSGAVSYSGNIATFTPTTNLVSDATYTATISTGAKNLAGIPLAANVVWTFNTVPHLGPLLVDLQSVARFGIIAGVGVSNNAGFSQIRNMDVGISPGVRSSITGFPPATIVNGAMYASDDIAPAGVAAMLTQAKLDLTAAYLFAEGAVSPAPATVSGDQGGLTLTPGIYKSTSTLLIQSGDLTLDAQGDANAVWIFQVASAFTTVGGAGGNIILKGGAQGKNIFWQTGSSATIGGFTTFYGNILALSSITMGSGATAYGRMLARNGSVVMTSGNIIDKP